MSMTPNMRLLMAAQARKRRDSQGRYMGEDNHYPPRYDERTPRRTERRAYSPNMGGEGYVIWDSMDTPYMPPERYGQPDHRRNVTDMRQYRTRSHMDSGEHEPRTAEKGMIGFGEGEKAEKRLTRDKAEKWVRRMRSNDRQGGMWTMADAKELAKCYELEDEQELVDFYAALNMVYSDYADVAKEFGVDDEAFYAALACAFLYDDDGKAPAEKLAAYYTYVVPHGEE